MFLESAHVTRLLQTCQWSPLLLRMPAGSGPTVPSASALPRPLTLAPGLEGLPPALPCPPHPHLHGLSAAFSHGGLEQFHLLSHRRSPTSSFTALVVVLTPSVVNPRLPCQAGSSMRDGLAYDILAWPWEGALKWFQNEWLHE